jgi:hypothetical protein
MPPESLSSASAAAAGGRFGGNHPAQVAIPGRPERLDLKKAPYYRHFPVDKDQTRL